MAKLVYASNMSLDGCTEDADGDLAWAPPDDEVFVAHTELMRSFGTYLYGRRMYEAMSLWETDPSLAEASDLANEFASVWQAPDKVVYSTTLPEVATARTRLERHFDPSTIRDLKASATSDLLVGGPTLAAQALAAGLVDECRLFVYPVILGGTKPALPADQHVDLDLTDEHRFANGVVRLTYRVR